MRPISGRVCDVAAALCVAVAVAHAAGESTTTTTIASDSTTTTTAPSGEARLPEMVVEAPPVYSAASSHEINAERFVTFTPGNPFGAYAGVKLYF